LTLARARARVERPQHRRHLSESQRGMIAGAIANMSLGDNQREKEGGPIEPPKKSTAEAAAMLNVGVNTVKRGSKADTGYDQHRAPRAPAGAPAWEPGVAA
jgi:hypothetical protein